MISLAIAAGLFGYFLGLLTVYLGGALYDARARRRAARHPPHHRARPCAARDPAQEHPMTWIVEVLERNGIIPSANIADQVIAAIPRQLLKQVLYESVVAVLSMRGIRDDAGDLAGAIATAGAQSVSIALELGDDDLDDADTIDKRVVDLEGRP